MKYIATRQFGYDGKIINKGDSVEMTEAEATGYYSKAVEKQAKKAEKKVKKAKNKKVKKAKNKSVK